MHLANRDTNYGWIAISLHWLTALVVIALFVLGLWMVDLDFYNPWYHDAPYLHKSVGVLLMAVMLFRWIWRLISVEPQALPTHGSFTRLAAKSAQRLLYLLVFAIGISGYLISTAEGQPLQVFNWFALPAYPLEIENQADIAGSIHLWLAVSLISLASIHALAALKHHFIDRDATLKRMLSAN
ncbi:cytochrome b [Thiomicrorhabdus heinhorstiae]|uniref:Cytochrome b n=1 Tax=Thiomicrorhabdus heinhorstiae TaxID=2748010 RepID=A0ABS0BXD6_9GAMM|nr:cytochrome b [Thiomicrorhabdus heinhorstiae]MBF6057740.1 cytochrome b [Thiomicrorhabdus heinhorstiae]